MFRPQITVIRTARPFFRNAGTNIACPHGSICGCVSADKCPYTRFETLPPQVRFANPIFIFALAAI